MIATAAANDDVYTLEEVRLSLSKQADVQVQGVPKNVTKRIDQKRL